MYSYYLVVSASTQVLHDIPLSANFTRSLAEPLFNLYALLFFQYAILRSDLSSISRGRSCCGVGVIGRCKQTQTEEEGRTKASILIFKLSATVQAGENANEGSLFLFVSVKNLFGDLSYLIDLILSNQESTLPRLRKSRPTISNTLIRDMRDSFLIIGWGLCLVSCHVPKSSIPIIIADGVYGDDELVPQTDLCVSQSTSVIIGSSSFHPACTEKK